MTNFAMAVLLSFRFDQPPERAAEILVRKPCVSGPMGRVLKSALRLLLGAFHDARHGGLLSMPGRVAVLRRCRRLPEPGDQVGALLRVGNTGEGHRIPRDVLLRIPQEAIERRFAPDNLRA